jgi:hypothetical protein
MKLKRYIFIIVIAVFFSECKKYPENIVWFRNVEKINFFNYVRLVKYTVNGVDSLDALSKYIGSNSSIKDINKTFFESAKGNGKDIGVFKSGYGGGVDPVAVYYRFSKNKKEISFVYGKEGNFDTSAIKVNIFIDDSPWQILELKPGSRGTGSGSIKRLKKNHNGNTYEMQFNSML